MNRFVVKQYLKMLMQNILFPLFYRMGCIRKIDKKLIIFADSHRDEIPYSMEDLYRHLKKSEYQVVTMTKDCDRAGYRSGLLYMLHFMLLYARASYVFLCDNFLPVASCKKRDGTQVIQMWHAGGMLKKYAYDTPRDIPTYYKGNVFKNYTLIITSDENCNPAYISGMRADPKIVKGLGLSRTDRFFHEPYLKRCKKEFFASYPKYTGKKIALWAPTFRGNAGTPKEMDISFLSRVQEALGEEWQMIVKLHPHMEKHLDTVSCTIPTEKLLPVADVLISDYSSVIYDYVLLDKPLVLYAWDLEEFIREDQFYIDYYELPGKVVTKEEKLAKAVLEEYEKYQGEQRSVYRNKMQAFREKYLRGCDGQAKKRLLEELHLS